MSLIRLCSPSFISRSRSYHSRPIIPYVQLYSYPSPSPFTSPSFFTSQSLSLSSSFPFSHAPFPRNIRVNFLPLCIGFVRPPPPPPHRIWLAPYWGVGKWRQEPVSNLCLLHSCLQVLLNTAYRCYSTLLLDATRHCWQVLLNTAYRCYSTQLICDTQHCLQLLQNTVYGCYMLTGSTQPCLQMQHCL